MYRAAIGSLALALVAAAAQMAAAHFVVLIPSADVLSANDPRTVELQLLFTHPMEQGPVMQMDTPRQFRVQVSGQNMDLLNMLRAEQVDGKTTYRCTYPVTRPGDHVFYVEPVAYWEPNERKYIVHYTKVVVDCMGGEEGWDALLGLPVEIEPLTRPYGLWTGNTFRGVVRHNGEPVPFATVEVEYYNEGGKVQAPNDALVTQVVKADAQGVFSYTMPRAGWWGFAALVDGAQKTPGPGGEMVDIELGGLIWVKTVDMK